MMMVLKACLHSFNVRFGDFHGYLRQFFFKFIAIVSFALLRYQKVNAVALQIAKRPC
jgi:hypothetical protein